jgi:hypothetical protein
MSGLRARWIACGLTALAIAGIGDASAQQSQPTPLPAVQPQPPLRVSPRGAMVRAMIVPGWGHAAIGAYSRGAFYVALESLTAYTLLRTRSRLGEARQRADFRESFVRTSLEREGVTDPAIIETRLAEDAVLTGLRDLTSSRESQQEDIVAFSIFVIFLTGADAFVSAHLARFPTPIEVDVAGDPDAGLEIRVSVPLPH